MSVRTGRVRSCLLDDQSADGDDVSTAIRTVASVTDAPLDTDSLGGTVSALDSGPDSDSRSASTDENSIEASAQAMHREALLLLPRSALEPVLLASCPWYRRLPAAAARACLADVDTARRDGDLTAVLRDWRARAEPFQR